MNRSLYGSSSGDFAVLLTPDGWISPPYVGALRYLGPPEDVVRRIVYGGRLQAEVATALGVSQQSVSRYLSGLSVPELTESGWRALVRLHEGP